MIRPFDYIEPGTLEEVLAVLDREGDGAKILAGGTDLVVQMKQGKIRPRVVVGLRRLRDLAGVELFRGERGSALHIGPMTLLSGLGSYPGTDGAFILLREAALAVGDRQIRNRATIGGNLANGSPSADMAPALLALGAQVRLTRKDGERIQEIEAFYQCPFQTCLDSRDLLTEVFVDPVPEGSGAYAWMPKRTAVDETLVGVAAWVTPQPDGKTIREARLALNSVSPVPMRAKEAEAFLREKEFSRRLLEEAGEIASGEVFPRSRAEYRRTLVSVLAGQALEKAWQRSQEKSEEQGVRSKE